MALINSTQENIIYLKVKNGQIILKHKDKSIETFKEISGTIYDVKYEMDSYKDQEHEEAKIYMKDGNEIYCLQMRTESGYFRGFCNSMKSGDITKPVIIRPFMEDKDGANSKTTIFVKQGGAFLKHYHTLNNMGDLPTLKLVNFRGKEVKDGTEQTQFFKNWLVSHFKKDDYTNYQEDTEITIKDVSKNDDFELKIPDDLPF